MFNIYQNKYNPSGDIETAIRIWNGGINYSIKKTNRYYTKIMKHYNALPVQVELDVKSVALRLVVAGFVVTVQASFAFRVDEKSLQCFDPGHCEESRYCRQQLQLHPWSVQQQK